MDVFEVIPRNASMARKFVFVVAIEGAPTVLASAMSSISQGNEMNVLQSPRWSVDAIGSFNR